MKTLIDRIRARIAEGRPCDHPGEWLPMQLPVKPGDLAAVEMRLGFPLPDLLRRLYMEIGNGGFGPVFGLIPLTSASLGASPQAEAELDLAGEDANLVNRYRQQGGWPGGLVPTFYCGCTVFELVDCRDPAGPVVWFDAGSDEISVLNSGERIPVPSLARRLEAWLDGEQVW
jgi:hypothetical protein